MTNAVSIPGTGAGLISREALASSLNNAAMSMPSISNNQYLKMDKNTGEWVFGQEETLVEPDSLWAVNPASLKHGWVAWDTNKGGAPVEEAMVPISRALPPESSLPQLPPGTPSKKQPDVPVVLSYQRQQSVEIVCISGEDEGTVCEYKQNSVGAMKMFGTLTNALLAQLEKSPDDIVAVVKLASDPYPHKKYGRIFNPVFKIVEWRALDNTAPVEDASGKEEASDDGGDPSEEDAKLAAEYEAEAAAKAKKSDGADEEAPAPRRRQRR